LTLQPAEMRMIMRMCDVKVTDRFMCSDFTQTDTRNKGYSYTDIG